MLDMVYLHCGANAVFLNKHPGYVKRDRAGRQVTSKWHWPELNFDNLSLREYLYSNMAYWVTVFHVDGFRCDVADGVPMDFWDSMRERLEVLDPKIGLLAEGERAEDQLKAFDINYGFTWFRVLSSVMEKGAAASALRDTWKQMTGERPKGSRFIRFIDTHDVSNDSWYKRTEEKWGFRGVNAALVLNFTINGVPFIYNGEEIADKARNSIFGDLPVDWSNGNTAEGKARFSFLQQLIKLRIGEKAFSNGSLAWIDNDSPNSVVSFERDYDGKRILVIVNLKMEDVYTKLKLDGGDKNLRLKTALLQDGVSGNIEDGFKMKGYGYWIGLYSK
jgi:glycosidase